MNEEKECGKISDNPIQLDNLHTDYGKKRDIKYFTIVDYMIANFNTNLRFLSLLSFGLAALFIIYRFCCYVLL
ncbi:hypothetical protein [Desulfofundulus thermocisternus]|uniref:hypothetical protein n=1 Tax=Desulfofundulus thermocisternus TaxID=42471 RepID=UPI00217D0DB3|nr:hypothetical protein [Desulfofundulus thermocisternus]MCS5695259.1 hypothetical protein [Desulfofundulus thermocisternus]